MLEDRGRELERDVQSKIRDARNDGSKEREGLDEGETCEVDVQTEIEFALLQIKGETLHAINAAIHRLDEGTYGDCVECGDQIHEARLRALPFAVRCWRCEDIREIVAQRDRGLASLRASSPLFL